MKYFLLTCCIFYCTILTRAQTCPQIEGLTPVPVRFGNQPESNFPTVPLYWNRFYTVDITTGQLASVTCTYSGDPNIHEFAYCACYLTGLYLRRVTDVCDLTPCGGDLPGLALLPKTNNNNSGNSWSQAPTWNANQLPDVSTAPAVLITKSIQVDADLNLTSNHWLAFTDGNSTVVAGNSITNNSIIKIYPAAQFENFGTIKGSGAIQGSIINSGILSPGNSPGKFTVAGNYTATSSAIHEMEIASVNSYDTINIISNASSPGGDAILNGALNVSLLNGFVPSSGDTYKIITYNSASGAFSHLSLPALPSGLAWSIHYNITDVTLQVNTVALPVSFIYARVFSNNNGVQIEWQTADEINVKNYQIEKSIDGMHFSLAGKINASGAATNKYRWNDLFPANGINYYRIKSVDADSSFMYSQVMHVNISVGNQKLLWPNPVKRGEMINIKLQNNSSIQIEIMNAEGRVIYRQPGIHSGTVSIPVSESWSAGQYLIRLKCANKIEFKKLLVL